MKKGIAFVLLILERYLVKSRKNLNKMEIGININSKTMYHNKLI